MFNDYQLKTQIYIYIIPYQPALYIFVPLLKLWYFFKW